MDEEEPYVSDAPYYYELRLTPYPNTESKTKFCRNLIGGFIEAVGGQNYIFGQEYERNHHFHIVFSSEHDMTIKKEKDELRDLLYTTFEVPTDKKGNPTYKFSPVRALNRALCYAVKDGNYDSSEAWKQVLALAYENSHSKTLSMGRSVATLTEGFLQGEINEKTLWIELGHSRAQLGIPLSTKWMDEMLFSIKVLKNKQLLNDLWEDRIIRQQLKS